MEHKTQVIPLFTYPIHELCKIKVKFVVFIFPSNPYDMDFPKKTFPHNFGKALTNKNHLKGGLTAQVE